jgi:Holliday junction DNA helicase RuvA
MYDYFTGKLIELNPSFAVIECFGVGYFVHISLHSYSQLTDLKECKLYIHQIVREDLLALFGFSEKKEREIFRQLISVSGIGANTARMILSSLNPEGIREAIVNSDVNTLKKIKGIGIKTAQRIIIDLKDKLGKAEASDEIFLRSDNTIKFEALSALTMLGFSKKEVEQTLDKITTSEKNLTVEQLVKRALKAL